MSFMFFMRRSPPRLQFLGRPLNVNSLSKEFRAEFWKNEQEVFLRGSHFGVSVSMRVLKVRSLVFISGNEHTILSLKFYSLFTY